MLTDGEVREQMLRVRMSAQEWAYLQALAERDQITMSNTVRRAIGLPTLKVAPTQRKEKATATK